MDGGQDCSRQRGMAWVKAGRQAGNRQWTGEEDRDRTLCVLGFYEVKRVL